MDKLKLAKLLYLAERESMAERGRPIFFDEFYSLKDGPICSNALNGLNQKLVGHEWGEYIKRSSDRDIEVANQFNDVDFDEFSRSDLDILNKVWEKFGWMRTSVIRRWTHDRCAEYTEVGAGQRAPITYRDIYAALGYEDPDYMASQITEYRSIEAALRK